MAEYEALVDSFPQMSLQTALSFVRGNPVPKRDLALAALNVVSYGANLFIKDDPIPVGSIAAMEAPWKEEAEAAFAAVMPDQEGTVAHAAAPNRGAWLTIIKTLLPIILQILA